MRLIDADALIEFIDAGHLRHPSELCFSELDVVNMLNHAPIAYDVEKVLDGLEDIKEAVSGCFGTMCSECKYTKKCYTGELSYKVAIDNAISVVKRGGVE